MTVNNINTKRLKNLIFKAFLCCFPLHLSFIYGIMYLAENEKAQERVTPEHRLRQTTFA